MEKIKKFRYTIIVLGVLAAAAAASLFQEIGAAMSGVMIQLGWCRQGNSLCLLNHYLVIGIVPILLAFLIDLVIRRKPLKTIKNDNPSPKIETGINRRTSEIRQFYILAYHTEWVVTNAFAKDVANYLLRKQIEIARRTEIGNKVYFTENIEYFDPSTHGTFEYAMVVRGTKMTPVHKFFLIGTSKATSDPILEPVDMFTITVIQGGDKTSRVTFDTEIRELFPIFSNWLEQDLKELFSIRRKKRTND